MVDLDEAMVLSRVCTLLAEKLPTHAERALREELPFVPVSDGRSRSYTERQMVRVFRNDGFVDRYDGKRLVFPAVLRTVSLLLPKAFPYHPNWKFGECHQAWWSLYPTIDHIVPVARGGADQATNWVTTSMRNNSMKSHWLLDELRWSLVPAGNINEWDGLLGWFMDFEKRDPSFVRKHPYLLKWHRATTSILCEGD